MRARFTPEDEAARERARKDHATSFVLEAGAGTGKTTLLVDRMEWLVRQGHARLPQIAAVTFTENAATTMKLRLRERLEAARSAAETPAEERARCASALDVLERAPISTIHALCASMLQERPLECGVLPGLRTADEAEADLLFSQAWEEWLLERFTSGDDVLLEALEEKIPLESIGPWGERTSLRGLARTLVDQRDLAPVAASAEVDVLAFRDELLAKAARAAELVRGVPEADVLCARLLLLIAFAEKSRGLEGRALAVHLASLPRIQKSLGHKTRWSAEALQEARGIAAWTEDFLARFQAARGASLHGRLVLALADVVKRYERKKRERGVLDFLDLLIKARDALRDRPAVLRYFRRRFPYLIIDEFQDTDPVQVEVAELLSGGEPGRLAVVGDAKQSIYRFRRAEVALFRRASVEAATRPGHAVLHLTQNFRSRPAILRFVNRVFAGLIQASDEAGQPPYEPIAPPPGLPEEPSVVALRFGESYAEGEGLLRSEASALAAFLARLAAGAERVRDPASGEARPSRAGDVMVLVRRLSQVRHLEDALVAAGLRFTVEGGKSFFDRQEVNEALALLKAVDDPSDRLSLVAALRSSFLGVSDRDIVAYSLAGGQLWIGKLEDQDRPGAAALAPALELLGRLHRQRTRLSVPALLETLYEETRVLAAFTRTRRGESAVANLEKVVTLARQSAELGALTLRGFIRLLEERTATAREEPDLPTTRAGDPETVRILTVHKAKGLEAPVVALFDTADNAAAGIDVIPLFTEGRIAVGFRKGCRPPQWDELEKREQKKAAAENRRLLYVAATRPRDLLVIPRPPDSALYGGFWKDLWAALPAKGDADVRVVDAATVPAPEREAVRSSLQLLSQAEGGDAVAALWEKKRRELLATAAHRPYVPIPARQAAARTAPPSVAPGAEVRAGRDCGRLVHRLLEWAPLGPPDAEGLVRMALALAPALGGLDEAAARRAAEAAARVMALPVFVRAGRASRVWREVRLFFPDGADLVEGVCDLVFQEEEGLVVVDYKTDAITPGQALAQAAHHAPQLQLYGRGLARALDRPVKERLVVFTALARAVPV
jgi:ATP-dependent helicase/nuclease subunit A